MTHYEIPTLKRTIDGRRSMRSISDALEALRGDGRLEDCSFLEIRTNPLPSQTDQAPSLVLVVCHLNPPEKPRGVALPTSWEFRGRPLGESTPETFEILRLDRAKVDEDGTVTLSDGTRLKAVEVIPAALPWELTELQKRIVFWTTMFIRFGDKCYYGPPTPDLAGLDFAKLRALEVPKLEAVVQFVADAEPTLKINRQTVANALGVCGMRVPHQQIKGRG